jgi:uncharacterized damage-inducible protein DinB
MSVALDQNLALLAQGVDLLRRIDDSIYEAAQETHEASHRVGPHLRHCLDAYRCLLDGLPTGVIDYDARERDARVEIEREAGIEAVESLIEDLRVLDRLDDDHEIGVLVDTPDGVAASTAIGRSTLYRELQFLVGHTVHHFALIAMILRQHGVEPGREFGIAPSTLQHWEQEETVRA